MIIEIPVKRHVYEFFCSDMMYGPKNIVVKRYTPFFGNLCWGYFSKYPLRRWDYTRIKARDIRPDVIKLDLQMNVDFTILDRNLLEQFGDMLEDVYNFSIVMYARGRNSLHNNTAGAVARFMEAHGVKGDLLFEDSARRTAQRFEAKIRSKKMD